MNRFFMPLVLLCITLSSATSTHADEFAPADNATWGLSLSGFFDGLDRENRPKALNIYPSFRDGKCVAAVGTSRSWNTAQHVVDFSNVTRQGNRATGTVKLTLVPDPWVPKHGRPFQVSIEIDVTFRPDPTGKSLLLLEGKYKSDFSANDPEDMPHALTTSREGTIGGGVGPTEFAAVVPENVSYDLVLQHFLPGRVRENHQRRISLSIGVKDGKVVSARVGPVSMRNSPYDYQPVEAKHDLTFNADTFEGTIAFDWIDLDGRDVRVEMKVSGVRVQGLISGTYSAVFTADDGGDPMTVVGEFGGTAARDRAYDPPPTAKDDRPWFTEVPNWQPVAPGEHPRLFFRKADVPELRRRAQTPEGQVIVARLRELLGGGEAMPTVFNPAKAAYEKNGFKYQTGAYSVSHAAGFGMLYQLTGDKKYADLARQCVELALAGQRDHDDRYSWVAPGGELRAGPSIGWYAVAYDLCYDAWDPEFRTSFAQAIQNYNDLTGGEAGEVEKRDDEEVNPDLGLSLRSMCLSPRHGPNSNHYGSVTGGAGLAVLAIRGDPGTDEQLLARYQRALDRQIIRALSSGFGDGGYFNEGMGAVGVFTDTAFVPYLQAMKTAMGRDYTQPRRNASMISLIRVYEMLGPPAYFPYRSAMGPTYGSPDYEAGRRGFSRSGQFVQGMGAVPEHLKPAMLWTFNTFVEPDPQKRTFDTVSPYPHRAILALINWPIGVEPVNPAELLPRVTRDTKYDYFVLRNRWQDNNDIVTTLLIGGPRETKPRGVFVWGFGGQRINFMEMPMGAAVTQYESDNDGNGIITAGGSSLVVDYSGKSGAEGLVVVINGRGKPNFKPSDRAKHTQLKIENTTFDVLTLSAAAHPEPKLDGSTLTIGGVKIEWNDGKAIVTR